MRHAAVLVIFAGLLPSASALRGPPAAHAAGPRRRVAAEPQLVLAPAPLDASGTARALGLYRQLAESPDSYAALAGVQAGVLACGSDVAAQRMHSLPLNLPHVFAMGTLGCLLSGAFNAVWLRQLEARFPGSGSDAIAAKTSTDYACATLINSAYLLAVPLLAAAFAGGGGEVGLLDGWTTEGFRDVMLLELVTFTPYNLCAFKLVPPNLRPLTSAGLSAASTVVISGVTLGFV